MRAKIESYDVKTHETIIDIGGRKYPLDGMESAILEYFEYRGRNKYFNDVSFECLMSLINDLEKTVERYKPIAVA